MEKIAGPKPMFGGQVMFPNEWLAAEDLQGKDVTVEIAAVKKESVRTTEGKDDKFVLVFKGAKKKLILNKTNAMSIAKVTGEREAKKWVGCKIVLHHATCAAFGQQVDCIRIRETAPAKKPTATANAPASTPAQDEAPWTKDDNDFEKEQAALFDAAPTNLEG